MISQKGLSQQSFPVIKNAFLHTDKKPAARRHAQKLPFLRKNFSALQNGNKAGLPALRPLEKTKAFPTYFPPSRFPNDRLFADENGQRRTRRLLSHRAFTCFPFHLRCPTEKSRTRFCVWLPCSRTAPETLCAYKYSFFRLYHTARFYARKILLKIQTPQTFEHKMSCSSFGSFSLSSSFWQMPRLKISLSLKKRS